MSSFVGGLFVLELVWEIPPSRRRQRQSCHITPGFVCGEWFACDVQVSATDEHVGLLKTIFDFSAIKALLAREDFSLLYDSMHGVQGPYAKVQMSSTVLQVCVVAPAAVVFLLAAVAVACGWSS